MARHLRERPHDDDGAVLERVARLPLRHLVQQHRVARWLEREVGAPALGELEVEERHHLVPLCDHERAFGKRLRRGLHEPARGVVARERGRQRALLDRVLLEHA